MDTRQPRAHHHAGTGQAGSRPSGPRHRPEDLGITWPEIDAALVALPAFVAREGLWYSVANDLVYGEREAATVRQALDF
jgi:hypothetical protein